MRESLRAIGGATSLVGGLVLLASTLLGGPAGASEVPEPVETTATSSPSETLDDAVLRWGVNNESNNAAHAPGTFNFFSAGRLPDPGRGGTTVSSGQWRQSVGNVAVEKWNGTRWAPATWAGLSTDSAGAPLGAPTAGRFSNHTFVFRGGVGTVDRESGDAHIAWDGDLTVLYYSGMSFFYLSDPALDVTDGEGRLTATVQGYASSVDDPTSWAPVPPETVTVAELPSVDLGELGFTAQPAYAGSFPASFVSYMDRLGTGAFWRDSGGSTDAFKKPLPLTVSFDAAAAAPQPTPTQGPTRDAITPPDVRHPPTPATTVTATAQPGTTPARAAAPPAAPPPTAASAAAAPPALEVPPRPATEVTLLAASGSVGAADAAPTWPWLTGGGLLLAAAGLLLVPVRPGRS